MKDTPQPEHGFLRRCWISFRSPSARWGFGAILLGGGVAALVLWGGFTAGLAYTNTTEFCISCHEMADNVGQEWMQSPHFKNPSGVRAGCPDCHVPRALGPKLWRKIQAANDVYHHLLGTIDTPEKFKEHRAELAERVWARMEANDSANCRHCHSYDAMDFHKQTLRAQEKMKEGLDEGKTCIECHKGIAHKRPPRDD